MDKQIRKLDIYVDESGNFDKFSKHNLIYSVAFVMVDSNDENTKPLSVFENKLLNIIGGEHFVHTGNLVRGEKPYQGMQLRERQDLFYVLFLFAKFSKYRVACSIAEKRDFSAELYEGITDSIIATIRELEIYINGFDSVIIHYDNGQEFLKGVLLTAFRGITKKVTIVKTLQQENPFMQVADLFSYFELIKYKISKSGLSKHEINFFGMSRKIKKDYLKPLENKYI